ncbi:MAG: gamma-glutamyl-gamma-aminobutyrate hydrolase family protein, partial [Chloroflexi bacterium]|nr:gamma-glutamyl-gamma-aminobutyrate hydrolase family protein [Chloroflexota bacterium]
MARIRRPKEASGRDEAIGGSERVSVSGDVEIATYLKIARERERARPDDRPIERTGETAAQPASPETVVVLDFGSQYSMLIARRVRECHVYCELLPFDAPREEVERLRPRAFILSGGPASVYEEGAPQAPSYVFESGVPVLGICYGMQLLVHQLGGKVAPGAARPDGRASAREYGHAVIQRSGNSDVSTPLLEGLPASMP